MEWSTKSIGPPSSRTDSVKTVSRSSTLVASAGIIGAPRRSESLFTSPIRTAIGVFVSAIFAPSSTALSATFHAIDKSFNAPKMMPLFPCNKL